MIKKVSSFTAIKKGVERLKGNKVEVMQNLGRNKIISYLGTITGVYPSLFTVLPDVPIFDGKTSFSYSEIMCGNVKIKKPKIE